MKRIAHTWLPAVAAFSVLAIGCNSGDTCAAQQNETHAVMLPELVHVEDWQEQHEALPLRDSSAPPMAAQSVEASLDYDPVARNQGACGDCWMWASTMVVEVALNHQRAAAGTGENVELSVQWGNTIATDTKLQDSAGTIYSLKGPCCGGTLSLFADIYNANGGEVIPVGGKNTEYEDANRSASKEECTSSVARGDISQTAAIDVGEIVPHRLGSTASASATIDQVKHAIDSGEAVYMSMQLPNGDAWDGFRDMWTNGTIDDLYNPTQYCGTSYESCDGAGGHALVIVGYADDGTDDSYWTVLNSWGAPSNRPDGTYRMQMRGINYGCAYGSIDALHFQTISIP